jgi:hypothetical protein
VYDKERDVFLSTERRREFLAALPFIVSVKVLDEGQVRNVQQLIDMIGLSQCIAEDHLERLRVLCQEKGLNVAQMFKETDASNLMEGLYLKVEEDGIVKERYKYVRQSFLQTVFDSETHWLDRPLMPNCLKPDTLLF